MKDRPVKAIDFLNTIFLKAQEGLEAKKKVLDVARDIENLGDSLACRMCPDAARQIVRELKAELGV